MSGNIANNLQISGVDRATRYVNSVLAGDTTASEWVIKACKRQRDDLARTDWVYVFDSDEANRVVAFIESLEHTKGREFAGRPLLLGDWQCFIVTTVFGWVSRKHPKLRRFRIAYIECPRKNGKSTLTAPVGLYMMAADGEPGAEVVSAATTRDQAKIVWTEAHSMVTRSSYLRSEYGLRAGANHLYLVGDRASTFKSLSREQNGNLDGLNVHCGLIDEVHAHKERAIWDVVETATGARAQPLMWSITTSGTNRAGICYEQHTYTKKILSGNHIDDSYFGIIYTIDKGDLDNWDNPHVWAKANPNIGVSVSLADLARKAAKARQMPAARSTFLTKHLCVWTNADSPWLDIALWNAGTITDMCEEEFAGEEFVMACDLATRTDIATQVRVYPREVDGVQHYCVFATHYVPESCVEDDRNGTYAAWAANGHLEVMPGEVVILGDVEADIRKHASSGAMLEVAFDPWQAAQMMATLSDEGVEVVEYRATVKNMSAPMKELEAAVLQKRVHHNGDPVLAWMIGNVVCHTDVKDNIYPRKESRQNKIDGAVALIMAMGRVAVLCGERTSLSQSEPLFG